LCSPAWNGGDFGTDGAPQPLQGCVNDAGVVAVIPGTGNTCDVLGLASYVPLGDGPGDAEALLVLDVEKALIERYNTGSCNTSAEAAAAVRQTLDEFGLDDWAVFVNDGFTERDPCATVAFDRPTNVVFISAVGLTPIDEQAGHSDTPSQIGARNRLDIVLGPGTCLTAEAARIETFDVLEAFGLSRWEITILDTFSADEPCARVVLDSSAEAATIISAALAD
jgi:hypothetical protein